MRILPKTPAQQVRRLTTLIPSWAQHQDAIGLSPQRVAQLKTLLDQARAAQLAAYHARDAARSATSAFEQATAQLVRQASASIRTIKITAKLTTQPVDVLSQALLPVPKTRGRIAEPGTPRNFTCTLLADGSVQLKWACDNPKGSVGTTYIVRRRIGDTSAFEHVQTRGVKHIIDGTIPAGTTNATYEITASRTTGPGTPGRYTVNFGTTAIRTKLCAA